MKPAPLATQPNPHNKFGKIMARLFVLSLANVFVCWLFSASANWMLASIVFFAIMIFYQCIDAFSEDHQVKKQRETFRNKRRNFPLILLIILCSSCGCTWRVQGVEVHAPTRTIEKKHTYVLGTGALLGFIAIDQLAQPEQKEKLRKSLNLQ